MLAIRPEHMRTDEPCTCFRHWNQPHARCWFTLEYAFGTLWFTAYPCSPEAASRSKSADWNSAFW